MRTVVVLTLVSGEDSASRASERSKRTAVIGLTFDLQLVARRMLPRFTVFSLSTYPSRRALRA